MAPDFTSALLFPVDCTRNFTSRIVCTPYSLYNKSLDYKDHSTRQLYVGYHIIQENNTSRLQMSMRICPEGYNFGEKNTCLQLVKFPEILSVLQVGQCLWKGEMDDKVKCTEAKNKSQQIIDRFNMTCKRVDISSSVYGNIGFISLGNPNASLSSTMNVLNNYLLQILPTATLTFMSWNPGLRGPNMNCPDRIYCLFYPLHKGRGAQLDDLSTSPPFVLCGREPIVSSTVNIPVQFEPFTCTDGSAIAISLQCDGIPNCPNAEDEDNCTSVCTNDNINCFTHCFFPTCRCNDSYYQCIDGGCMTFDKFCNGHQDCPIGEDEQGCVVVQKRMYNVSITLQNINLATGFCLSQVYSLPCVSQTECYNLQELCHYDTKDGIIVYCADGTHLGGHCIIHFCNH